MELKSTGKYGQKFVQIRNFLSDTSSFGRDNSELDISRKDNGDAFSKMEIVEKIPLQCL